MAKISYKGQGLTFQPRSLILEYLIDIAETTWPIEVKFHIETPYDKIKICTNCSDHMTKMVTTPING